MILRQVALLSTSERVSTQELMRVSAAIQKQVTRDFSPIWNIDATVDAFAGHADVPPGYWPVIVSDTIPVSGAAGYHLDERGRPAAHVLWSEGWSLSASHEVLEMLVDPTGSLTVHGQSVKDPGDSVNYLVEVCDPCESTDCAYKVNTGVVGREVLVSDFYTPEYFDPVAAPGRRYSFTGKLRRPRQVLNGGYLSWQTDDGQIWQLFGPAEMGYFQHRGLGRLHREQTDRLARGLRSAPAVLLAASGGCKLTRDPLTGFFHATTGDTVDLTINGTNGAARFLNVNYDGASVAGVGTTASFSVKQGEKILRCIVDAIPQDIVQLKESPCGTILDSVPFPGDPPTLDDLHIFGD